MNNQLKKKIMKIKITFLSLLAVSAAIVASAQVVEYDDMYFKSKDRAKMQASKPLTLKNISTEHEVATAINPTDSYSARTVNPSGSVEPAPYFIPDYTPTAINQNLNSNSSSSWNNCNCATAGSNPYYGMMPGYGGYGSPYGYGSAMYGYSPYGYGGYNGFNSGWSSMLSIGYGMGSYYPYGGSSWGMGYGMGMGSSLWNYGFNYYGGNYGYNSYYPGNVVIINNGDYNSRGIAYGKRASRSSDLNNTVNSSNRTTTMVSTDSQGRVRGANGRVSTDGTTNSNAYYQRGWRSNPETNSAARTNWSTSGRSGGESSNTGFSNSRSNSSFFENSSRSSNYNTGGSNFSSGGGSRSSGSVSSGSSSGARRGRD
jgi:hypothetical protein